MEQLSSIKNEYDTVVYARGAFDILHAGHIEFINYAKSQGDTLVLGIISDNAIRENKGEGRPVKNEGDRLIVADAIKGVDYAFVVPVPDGTYSATEKVLRVLKPDVFVLYDEVPEHTNHFKKLIADYQIKLVLDNSKKRLSTTELIKKIKQT
ncbi:MAG TPA: adenylyltransferase/cytidyltransferase family protein [Methylococcales bacterium]